MATSYFFVKGTGKVNSYFIIVTSKALAAPLWTSLTNLSFGAWCMVVRNDSRRLYGARVPSFEIDECYLSQKAGDNRVRFAPEMGERKFKTEKSKASFEAEKVPRSKSSQK